MQKISIVAGSVIAAGFPGVVAAQTGTLSFTGLNTAGTGLIGAVSAIVNAALPVIVGLGLLLFLWGLLKYLTAGGAEEAKSAGRNFMIWGIVILFVMVAVWGLVGVISQLTGVTGGGVPIAPSAPT